MRSRALRKSCDHASGCGSNASQNTQASSTDPPHPSTVSSPTHPNRTHRTEATSSGKETMQNEFEWYKLLRLLFPNACNAPTIIAPACESQHTQRHTHTRHTRERHTTQHTGHTHTHTQHWSTAHTHTHTHSKHERSFGSIPRHTQAQVGSDQHVHQSNMLNRHPISL